MKTRTRQPGTRSNRQGARYHRAPRQHRFVMSVLAILLAMPGAMLPCASGGCNTSAENPAETSTPSCCSKKAPTPQDPSPGRLPKSCDCPPECPAACGGGKVPCVSNACPINQDEAASLTNRIEYDDHDLPNRSLDGIFRPPRI